MPLPVGVTIRRGRPGDAGHVRDLLLHLGYALDLRTYEETFAQVVRHPEALVLVAAEGPHLIGYVSVSNRAQIRLGGRLATIDELVVDPAHRGRGVDAALLEAALSHCTALGCRRIEVATPREQRDLYTSHGFVEVDAAPLRNEPHRPG
ncbi:MAG TPA: GNAT family N-acetyltransferase [Candidatus Binatia bacterium]|nr:GNAT family N-acetyltransferase [Candidatus Binatia bacterium]